MRYEITKDLETGNALIDSEQPILAEQNIENYFLQLTIF